MTTGSSVPSALLAYLAQDIRVRFPASFPSRLRVVVMGCSSYAAMVIVGDVTDGGIDPEPYNTP